MNLSQRISFEHICHSRPKQHDMEPTGHSVPGLKREILHAPQPGVPHDGRGLGGRLQPVPERQHRDMRKVHGRLRGRSKYKRVGDILFGKRVSLLGGIKGNLFAGSYAQ